MKILFLLVIKLMNTDDCLLSNFKTKGFDSIFVTYDVVPETILTINVILETICMSLL